jgi:hypothetical protein
MGQTARFQETLRRLAMTDEGFVEDWAGLRLWPGLGIGPGSQDRRAAPASGVGSSLAGGCLPGMERRPGVGGECE